jgi:hypothetical protein
MAIAAIGGQAAIVRELCVSDASMNVKAERKHVVQMGGARVCGEAHSRRIGANELPVWGGA